MGLNMPNERLEKKSGTLVGGASSLCASYLSELTRRGLSSLSARENTAAVPPNSILLGLDKPQQKFYLLTEN